MDDQVQPVSGVDYPRTFQEFDEWFATEADYCRRYLIGLRWPSGFQCPRCGQREEPWVTQHLDYYLDEFTFRFTRRTSQSRGLLFYRLMQHAVEITPVPYHHLVGGTKSAEYKM